MTPPGLPVLLADAVRIELGLSTTVRTALDALAGRPPDDGASARVRLTLSRAGTRCLLVDVDGNGPRLASLRIDVQIAPVDSIEASGMGSCRWLVEAHHGGLEAEPGPLGGARFAFTLPPDDTDADGDPAADVAERPPHPPERTSWPS